MWTWIGALTARIWDFITLDKSVNASAIDMQYFSNALSFERHVYICWYEDLNEIVISIPIYFIFQMLIFSPNVGYIDSSKWQSTNLAVNKSPVIGFKYFIIERDSYPTYIPNLLWGPIFELCGGAIETYIAHPNILRWEMFGSWPKFNCSREILW